MKTRFRFAATLVAVLSIGVLAAHDASALDIKRMTLSNGAVLLVSEQHQLPMVTMAIAFDAGSRRDPADHPGLASLTANCLTLGTRDLTPEEFNRKVDFMGSSVSVDGGRDFASAGMTSLSKYRDDTLHLLAQALTQPRLAPEDIERKRAEQVAAIKAQEEQPGYVAGVKFNQMLFGDSPYGHPSEGYADSVEKLTPEDIHTFYEAHYKMGSAVIAVAGDVNADEIKARLDQEFASLSGSVPAQPEPPAPTVAAGLHPELIDRNVAQANVVMGFGGIARSNPDYYKIQVMNYILGGGGFASRLTQVVRSKAGLAYSVGSGFEAAKFPGSFEVSLQTKNQSASEAIRLVLQQIRQIQEQQVSEHDIDAAKKYLIGSFPLKIDRLSSIAHFMLQIELYGLGLDYADRYPKLIDAVTRDDILAVAKKYLHPDAINLVVVANQNEAGIKPAALEAGQPH